ncbi:hypothetical protein CU098_005807 [Rhizopus stolonifer]|uniref:Centrosomin N-terminal motif 1 domain-containing protein n=1 Tax=Rhizopus stolonifer TaxID=4846 RepID=A0A367KYD6_RHIST|nr:hypothetical protein CU098_005807 [Rhizopus stolonifer]
MSRFEDEMSTTNVSLLEEDKQPLPRTLNTSPSSISGSKKPAQENSESSQNKMTSKDYAKLGSLALKHQENTIDGLRKENFDLRLSLYFYEQRLSDMSPDNLDNVLKENVNLKVTIQTLSQELKKYKNVILELNQAVEILQNKPCPKIHGMSSEEQEEFERAKADAEVLHEENDKLSKMMADLSAENVKLRSTLRTRNTTSNTDHSSTGSVSSDRQQQNSEEMAELYRKLRQTKLKNEELQRIIQQQNAANRMYSGVDRDSLSGKNIKLSRQLEEELQMERQRNNRLMDELEEKSQQIQELQLELEQRTRSLQETKQQLRDKNIEYDQLSEQFEDLRVNNDNMDTLIENIRQLQDENDELVNEIQDREQEIEALEAEVEKLLSYLEKKEEEREILKNELQSANESHDTDIEAFEEHLAKTQEELDKKDQENKELMLELDELIQKSNHSKKKFEEELEKQYNEYNELVVAIRDRDVTMATLRGNFEAKTDTIQREKELLREEMEELKEQFHEVYDQLKEKERYIAELISSIDNREDSEVSFLMSEKIEENNKKWMERLESMEKEYQDKLKREQRKTNEQFSIRDNAYRALQQKLVSANQKNSLLNTLLDKTKRPSESSNDKQDKYSVLARLNNELRKELEDRDRNLEVEKKKSQELVTLYQQQKESIYSLQKQLERKETQLTNSLLARDTLKEKGEYMENILYEQATGGHSFRERSGSAMSSF